MPTCAQHYTRHTKELEEMILAHKKLKIWIGKIVHAYKKKKRMIKNHKEVNKIIKTIKAAIQLGMKANLENLTRERKS